MRNALILATTLAVPLTAQLPTGPAEQVSDFDEFLGVWEAEGTSRQSPDGEEMQWRAHGSFEKVLGGCFVRQRMVVDFAPALPQPLAMELYFGWDREREKPVAFEIANQGSLVEFVTGWDGGKLVLTATRIEDGKPVLGRTIMDVVDGKLWFKAEHASGAGEYFTHVETSMDRVTAAEAAAAKEIDTAFAKARGSEQIAALDFMCGRWRMQGTMIMSPGAEPTRISGIETVTPIWGGTILRSKVVGDPMEGFVYEGLGFYAWSPEKGCYESVMIDNMGGFWIADAHLRGERLLFAAAGTQMGMPMAGRTVVETEDGAMSRVYCDAFFGAHDAVRNFEGSYEKLK